MLFKRKMIFALQGQTRKNTMSHSTLINSAANADIQKDFLRACMTFEPDQVSFQNATKITEATEPMLEASLKGLNLCEPFTLDGLEEYTPLGFAAESLSPLALRISDVTGRFKDDIPTLEEEQSKKNAYIALRSLMQAAISTAGRIQMGDKPDGNEYQHIHMVVRGGDLELAKQCLDAGMPLEVDYLKSMGLAMINRTCLNDESFSQAFQKLQATSGRSDIKAIINDARALLAVSKDDMAKMHPAIRGALEQSTIDAGLVVCTQGDFKRETLEGLLDLGANPLGMRANDPQAKSALWYCLKDRSNLEAALTLLEKTPDMTESHEGISLLALAASRQAEHDIEIVPQFAAKGAKFANPDEAAMALMEACARAQMKTIDVALDQGADLNGVLVSAHGDAQNPLIQAARFDKAEVVRLLLGKGADPAIEIPCRGISLEHGGMATTKTNFLDEAVKLDAVQSLRAAGEALGVTALEHLKTSDRSPNAKEFLNAVKALGAIPPQAKPALEITM